MIRIIPRYIRKRFFSIFLYCLLAVILIFVIVDLVENMDRFIDKKVPGRIVFLYYLNTTPYTMLLVLPIATLLAAVFSVGGMARNNETVALKALGYSLYRVILTLLGMGLMISIFAFFLAEVVVVRTSRNAVAIETEYLKESQKLKKSRARNVEIQEPPNTIVSIGFFDGTRNVARNVEIKTFEDHSMISRIDAPSMNWEEDHWVVTQGIERLFRDEREIVVNIDTTREFRFQFSPREILLAGVEPEEMNMGELLRFIDRVRQTGGLVHQWLTNFHLRFAFPLSNVIIVLFSVPLAYNQRKRNSVMGFGISLLICFLYFGLVKMGETMGQKASLHPMAAAWMGNVVMVIAGVANLIKTRK